ncbi:MAG: apolipoprotein N-acyltransferase [Chitinophagaceae bacterium]
MLKKYQQPVLCVTSGLLLWASWPVSPFTFLIFIAFVPFLWMEVKSTSRLNFFGGAYLTMLVWNIATTWWMCNSTVPGGVAAMLANSLLMCIPCLGFYNVKKSWGAPAGYTALVLFWMTFEYIHLNWQLSWPWLTIGNVFAIHPNWVQWYEYTGTSGGTLWVLVVNILIFQLVKRFHSFRTFGKKLSIITSLAVLVPFLFSMIVQPGLQEDDIEPHNMVVVQPNINPYEKFSPGSQDSQLRILIALSESKIDARSSIVIWPETAINFQSGIEETRINGNPFFKPVWDFLQKHPQVKLVSGIEGYRLFTDQDKTASAKKIQDSEQYYDTYNTAGLLTGTGAIQLYHKSKLVPGVETLPSFLKFLDRWFEKFGGTTGGYASQKERTVLVDPVSGYRMAPAICYESIYGEFLTAYIRNGANVIVIITNDGWWANTSGYRQHMQYARLRAIETRRWIVRSANTGISCFISSDGRVFNPQPWDVAAAIKMGIPKNDYKTFYVIFGDILSRSAAILTLLILLTTTFLWTRKHIRKYKK